MFHCLREFATLAGNHLFRDSFGCVFSCGVCVKCADKGVARGHSKEGRLRLSGDLSTMEGFRPIGLGLPVAICGPMHGWWEAAHGWFTKDVCVHMRGVRCRVVL